MNLQQAKALKPRDNIYALQGDGFITASVINNSDLLPIKPANFYIFVQIGLRPPRFLDETNLLDWHLEGEIPLGKNGG